MFTVYHHFSLFRQFLFDAFISLIKKGKDANIVSVMPKKPILPPRAKVRPTGSAVDCRCVSTWRKSRTGKDIFSNDWNVSLVTCQHVLHQGHHVEDNECIYVSLQMECACSSVAVSYMLQITECVVYLCKCRCPRCSYWVLVVCLSVRLESLTTLDLRQSRPWR